MANSYGIANNIENAIRARDVQCVYCRKALVPTSSAVRPDWATIEHLNHQRPFTYQEGQTADDFAIACGGCNSSRGAKPLATWVAEQGIANTVAPVIKAYLNRAKAE